MNSAFSGYGSITPKTRLGQGVTIIFCTIDIPMTMLAMKSLGELLAIGVRSLVIKTETIHLKRTEPRHVKLKTICVSGCIIVFQHVMLASLSTSFTENWSFLESFYAWFITLSTIGFGDYVPLQKFSRETDVEKMSKLLLILYMVFFPLPYVMSLSFFSCILSLLVDSRDQIRQIRDRCMSCCSSFISFISRFTRKPEPRIAPLTVHPAV